MKKIFIIITAVLLMAKAFAQAPQKMSYQAVIRDASSVLVTSATVGMRISVLQGSSTGTAVYMETQTPTSNANGLVSLEIGVGTIVTGTFSGIDWSAGPYFIKTETDPTGGTTYTISGTSELLSVPYALHAKTAESIIGGIIETDPIFIISPANGINTSDITNWNNKLDAEVDGSVTNEIQALSISNDTIYLSNGGFVKLPAGFNGQYSSLTGAPTNVSAFTNDAGYLASFTEVDGSVTNELQALSISNDTVYLSNGGFIKLPATNAWSLNGNNGTVDGTNFIGTTDNVSLSFKVNNQKAGRIDHLIYNTSFGYQAGNLTTAGNNNTATGYRALYLNATGNNNTANGSGALYSNIGFNNTANGMNALYFNTTGAGNTGNGASALFFNITGNNNTANGYQALYSNTSGSNNTANGMGALYNNTGNDNTASGYRALYLNTTGTGNSASGYQAGYSNSTGNNNTANGYRALYLNATGVNNTANGMGALYSNIGTNNTANGMNALYLNTSGADNTATGTTALFSNSTGTNNTANGFRSLYNNTASHNSALGSYSLEDNTGGYNTALGSYAYRNNTTGNYNTIIGSQAGENNLTGSSNVFIGYAAGYNETGSNKLYIANHPTNTPLIYGDFATGNVGIGTTTSGEKLTVAGTIESTTGGIKLPDANVINGISYAQLEANSQTFPANSWTSVNWSGSSINNGLSVSTTDITFSQPGIYRVTIMHRSANADIWSGYRLYGDGSTKGKSAGFGDGPGLGVPMTIVFLAEITNTATTYQIQMGRTGSPFLVSTPASILGESLSAIVATIEKVN